MQTIANPHHLLVTLLLCNAACMEALPVFLDRLLNPVAAIIISVTAILAFGEILPQAVCKRYGLQVGAYLSWLVLILIWVTFPISWPIGKLLDWLLGEETVLFRRQELHALVDLHAEGDGSDGPSMLTSEEVSIIHGALDMTSKIAKAAMTPLSKVFSLPADAIVDRSLLEKIIEAGHSRVPVFEGNDPHNIVGLILVKELVLADASREIRVRNCNLREIDYILDDTPLYTVMELFRLKRRHMAVVTRTLDHAGQKLGSPSKRVYDLAKRPIHPVLGGESEVLGIITIEDVIEELLHFEIVDETDVYVDNLQTEMVTPMPADGALPPELVRYMSKRMRTMNALTARRSAGQPAAIAAAANAAIVASRRPALGTMRHQTTSPTVAGQGGQVEEALILPDV